MLPGCVAGGYGRNHSTGSYDYYHRPENDRRSAAEVRDWLNTLLYAGPLPVTEIEQKAAIEGITPDQLRYAKKKIGVDSRKLPDGSWQWFIIGGRGDPNPTII
jgi:hypothetical protein